VMRLACALGLVALATVVRVAVRTDGAGAILFSFVGFPALAIALVLYASARWRAGALRWNGGMRLRHGKEQQP
jgi:hypothetical protein